MNSIKALQILSRRMAKASYQEREAFNCLVDFVGQKQKIALIDNQLFGKLYIYLLTKFIAHYQCTVFDPIPQTELHRILDRDLRSLVVDFVDTLNMGENYQDASGQTAKWQYDEVAENLRTMINKALEEYQKQST